MPFYNSLQKMLWLSAFLWIVKILQTSLELPLNRFFALYPRHSKGLIGILFSPFLHADFVHLISNTVPLIVLGTAILYFYPKVSYKVFAWSYLATGLLVWLFARTAPHIGASGQVYAWAAFLFFSGIFRKDIKFMSLSLAVFVLYGGMLEGVFPKETHVSWESHLFGALVGIFCAFYYKNIHEIEEKEHIIHFSVSKGYRNIEGQNFKYVFKENKKKN
ncbi:MAG: rhomboid family intramembrane serine protease [Bacteroidetes bacterium]|nr:MAG: rhomboid family intramembrane serine protease [Bacteroidota bacterium]